MFGAQAVQFLRLAQVSSLTRLQFGLVNSFVPAGNTKTGMMINIFLTTQAISTGSNESHPELVL